MDDLALRAARWDKEADVFRNARWAKWHYPESNGSSKALAGALQPEELAV